MTESRAHMETREYYANAFEAHGASPRGVDWNTAESQATRFRLLCTSRVLSGDDIFDLGCGYGALLDHLRAAGWGGRYTGVDLVPAMIESARDRHRHDGRASFQVGATPRRRHGAVIANGILNVRGTLPEDAWRQHVYATLDAMFASAEDAIAFNFLHPWSDHDHRREHLWYSQRFELAEYTAERYSRWIEVEQAYGLFETTLRAFQT